MKRALVLALVVIGLGAGCHEAAAPPSAETLPPQPLPDQTPDPLPQLALMPLQTRYAEPKLPVWVRPTVEAEPAGSFSVESLETLVLTAEVVNGAPGAEVVLELDAPGEVPYQRLTAKLEGAPARAVFQLPVAGTWIHQNQMTGLWTARFLADGALAGTQTFEISE